jgi:catechol 2,3-dioxygenase-like lactoylglutathione lyase family enzyme
VLGHWICLVIDCPDPSALADFYGELLGLDRVKDTPDWVEIGDATGRPGLAFQRVRDFVQPRWPDPQAPQQMHIDVLVENLDAAQVKVLDSGGRLLDGSDKPIGYRVYADPAGHPFCLVTREGLP